MARITDSADYTQNKDKQTKQLPNCRPFSKTNAQNSNDPTAIFAPVALNPDLSGRSDMSIEHRYSQYSRSSGAQCIYYSEFKK